MNITFAFLRLGKALRKRGIMSMDSIVLTKINSPKVLRPGRAFAARENVNNQNNQSMVHITMTNMGILWGERFKATTCLRTLSLKPAQILLPRLA